MTFDIKFTRQGFENTSVMSRGLPRDSICFPKAEPGNLDIKRREHGILFISFQFTYCFSLQTSDYDVIFDYCVESASFKKCNVIVT